MLRHDCLLVLKHTKCYLYSLQYPDTHIRRWRVGTNFAKIQDFTAGLYPDLFFTVTCKIDNNFTRRLSYSKGSGYLEWHRVAVPQAPRCILYVFFFPFLFLSFYFFSEETPIHKMKIISGYFLQWWTKQFLKSRHQCVSRSQMPCKYDLLLSALKEPSECFGAGNRCSL